MTMNADMVCAHFSNMVSNVNIMRKSGKNQEKKERHDVKLLIMLRYSLQGLCAFPNMAIKTKIARKSEKIRKKQKYMMQTIANNVGVLFTLKEEEKKGQICSRLSLICKGTVDGVW